jgi:outer membrane immunogenic protein
LISTTALSFGLIGAASAADLGRAPPPAAAPAPYTWNGWYIGGNAGGGWTNHNNETFSASGFGVNVVSVSTNNNSVGFIGGGQLGYNWQWTPNWLIGFEGDFDGGHLDRGGNATFGGGPALVPPGSALAMSVTLNWLASARGRLGYTWDTFMLYGTGGGAWANVDFTGTATLGSFGTTFGSFSDTRSGWVAGGGGEWGFAPNWSLGVEYLHYQFDSRSATVSTVNGPVTFAFGEPRIEVVRARLNYKFGDLFGNWLGNWFGKAPVAARY